MAKENRKKEIEALQKQIEIEKEKNFELEELATLRKNLAYLKHQKTVKFANIIQSSCNSLIKWMVKAGRNMAENQKRIMEEEKKNPKKKKEESSGFELDELMGA